MTQDLSFFRNLPKAELHEHLDGSLRPAFLFETAKSENLPLPFYNEATLQDWILEKRGGSLNEYLSIFNLTVSLLQKPEYLKRAAEETILDWHSQGILYGEVRFAPELHLEGGMSGSDAVGAVLEGLAQGEKVTGTHWGLILCMMRHRDNGDLALELFQRFHLKGVVAIDLAGPEGNFPPSRFSRVFSEARQLKIPITIHAGEDGGPSSIGDALLMGAGRLGHGTRLIEEWSNGSPGILTKEILKRRVCLEMCPSSNFQTGAWKTLETYPFRNYLKQGIRVTLNTDNRLVSLTNLSMEYNLIFSQGNWSDRDIVRTSLLSFISALTPEVTRKEWIKNHAFPLFKKAGIQESLAEEVLEEITEL